MKLAIELVKHAFQPGESISGALVWQDIDGADRIDIRLIWYTSGKGTPDVDVVSSHSVSSPDATGKTPFSFTAPVYPFSYSGSLISVTWSIEAIVFPQKFAERTDLVVGPGGREVRLQRQARS